MNSWTAALAGAAVMYVIASIVTIADEYRLDNVFLAPICFVVMAITFIPCMVWGFIRHVVSPVPEQDNEFLQGLIRDSKRIAPNLYYCHDAKAKSLPNRHFLFRVKKN